MNSIERILSDYSRSFAGKTYSDENNDHDPIMDIFGVSPETKRENRQYWGRELGMVWQRVVTEVFRDNHPQYGNPIRIGQDEPCDLLAGRDAIDTKYRIGSGDSGTLKKFKQYGELLRGMGHRPVFLIVREDNLPAAITACYAGGWTVLTGDRAFEYVGEQTGVDLKALFQSYGDSFKINR